MGVHKRYSALGRGLDALISTDDVRPQGSSTINEIEIDQIEANPNSHVGNSTRKRFRNLPTVSAKSVSYSQSHSDRWLRTDTRSLPESAAGGPRR